MDTVKRKKVGILGGTFDPIHTGHLILAEEACEAFSLDYVLIMPNGNPPHKAGQVHASMAQRTRMAELAVADNPHLRVSDFERTPQDYHYTYETLEFLTEKNPDTDYYFILGADSLMLFHTWKEPQRICDRCVILAAVRDGMRPLELESWIEALNKRFGARIYPLSTTNIDISSNMIREKVQNRRSIRYYVPAPVEAYIYTEGLYQPGKETGGEGKIMI